MSKVSRRHVLSSLGVAALAGCSSFRGGSSQGDGGPDNSAGEDSSRDGQSSSGRSQSSLETTVPSADETLPLSMEPESIRDHAQSGGPGKDVIPSIDEPSFVDADAVDFLEPGDPVFGVERGGDVKAYPQKILVQHEIVNDTLDGDPVSVTYCPLTGTVQGFDRGETTFGVSGRLINSNLVMFDRETDTWWPQILATSIPGPWNNPPTTSSLREFRLFWTTWDQWRTQYGDTSVLSVDTNFARNYSNDPYGQYNPISGYYERDSTLFSRLNDDDRYEAKIVVMGARTSDGAVAFLKSAIMSKNLMTGKIGGTPVLAIHDPRFETAYVYENPAEQSFEYSDGRLTARDGSDFAPDELPLTRVHTFDAMWFAWIGYYPDSNVYE